jgi:hypothetical protein
MTVGDNLIVNGNLVMSYINGMEFPASSTGASTGDHLELNSLGNIIWATPSGGGSGASSNLQLTGNIITGGNVTYAGLYDAIMVLSSSTNVTLPTSGTLSTLTGSESLSNKISISTGNLIVSDNISVNGNLYMSGNIYASGTGSNSGNLDIGTSAAPFRSIYVQDIIMTSDERKKKDIEDVGYGLKDIMKLRSVKYNWKGRRNTEKTIGLLAQDVQEVIPEVVKVGNDKKHSMGVQYPNLIPVLIKAIQEQNDLIKKQDQRIKDLERQFKNSPDEK